MLSRHGGSSGWLSHCKTSSSFRVQHHGASPVLNPAPLQPPAPWLLASSCTARPDHFAFW